MSHCALDSQYLYGPEQQCVVTREILGHGTEAERRDQLQSAMD